MKDVDNEDLKRIEQKLDELLQLVQPLSTLLVRSHVATKQLGLNKNTLSKNRSVSKFEQVGSRRTYVEIGELLAVKKRTRRAQ